MEQLYFTATHEWVKFLDEKTAQIGISDFAQHALGDIVYVNLPDVGDNVGSATRFGDVESVKAVSDLISPVSGKVSETNDVLLDSPEKLNSDPMNTWIMKVTGDFDKKGLLTPEEYAVLIAQAK